VVVGRLAAMGRERAAEAESRAKLAAAREREAKLLAEAASAILNPDLFGTPPRRGADPGGNGRPDAPAFSPLGFLLGVCLMTRS